MKRLRPDNFIIYFVVFEKQKNLWFWKHYSSCQIFAKFLCIIKILKSGNKILETFSKFNFFFCWALFFQFFVNLWVTQSNILQDSIRFVAFKRTTEKASVSERWFWNVTMEKQRTENAFLQNLNLWFSSL